MSNKPAKEVIKPDLLPADLGGGVIQFIKRGDYARRTAETWCLKTKEEVKKDHVSEILEALDKGQREISADENPETLVKLWEAVREDYDDAIKEVEKKQQAEAEAKAKEEAEAKAKAEAETALVETAKAAPLDFGSLSSKFDMGTMDRFIPKEEVSDAELLTAFRMGIKMGDFAGWARGDLVVELEKRGQLNAVKKLADESGVPFSTIYNDARTARLFPPDKRKKDVAFTVYREVGAAKWTEDQKKATLPALVNEIVEGKHNSQTVREGVRVAQGKTPPPVVAPEDSETLNFILIDPTLEDPEQQVQISKGFPKELVGGGVVIINPKTNKKFVSFQKKGDNRWADLSEYKKPEPEPSPTPAATPAAKKPAKKK